jgi:hypothetical protein
MVLYTLEQRVFLYDTHVKYRSASKCRRKFWRKFRDGKVSSTQTIRSLMNKLRTTGLLIDKKQKHKLRVLTEEKSDNIGARLEHASSKSLKCLVQRGQLNCYRLDHINKSNPCLASPRPASRFLVAVGLYSLSSNLRSICSWHSFLMKNGLTCRDT